MLNNKDLHAPINTNPNPKTKTNTPPRLLDIGCGTGILTHKMSTTFPHATCIGLDLTPPPSLRPRPANLHFFQGNITTQKPTQWTPTTTTTTTDGQPLPLPRDAHLFDYVFSRFLILGMSDWRAFIRREYALLKPGGWAEIQDLAWEWYDAAGEIVSGEWGWLRCIAEDFEGRKGMDFACGRKAKGWMEEAGFVDVRVWEYRYPYCGSSEGSGEMRDFGLFNATTVPVALEHAIPRAMGISSLEEREAMRAEMVRTLRPGTGRYQIFYVTVGRKPEGGGLS